MSSRKVLVLCCCFSDFRVSYLKRRKNQRLSSFKHFIACPLYKLVSVEEINVIIVYVTLTTL